MADCAPEIAKYCSNVTPGAHRIVACLISYEDKISPRCRMTAYLGSDDLGVRMKALKAMAKSCSADILQYCTSVSAGGGRIYDCLMKNKATLTDECREPGADRSAVHEGLIEFRRTRGGPLNQLRRAFARVTVRHVKCGRATT